LSSSGDHEIRGFGLQLQLAEGDELLMHGVSLTGAPEETSSVEEGGGESE
jgi:hypothetical protein